MSLAVHGDQEPPITKALNTWLEGHGFQFNPFLYLDASKDPFLSRYLVDHPAFRDVWGEWVSWIFAAPGTGKTALRVQVTLSCWTALPGYRPFPVPYLPPYLKWSGKYPDEDAYLHSLGEWGARALFLKFAAVPQAFLSLSPSEQRHVYTLLAWRLGSTLLWYISFLEEAASPFEGIQRLVQLLIPHYMFIDEHSGPSRVAFHSLLRRWRTLEPVPSLWSDLERSPSVQWEVLCRVVRQVLGYRALYVLLDGADAVPTTAAGVGAIRTLWPLLRLSEQWAGRGVYLKAFLPQDAHDALQQRGPVFLQAGHVAFMAWPSPLLAELVRRRVYVASGGLFGSLDALSDPGVRDLEIRLARLVSLPREMLVLTRWVLDSCVARDESRGRIAEEDLQAGIQRYRETETDLVATPQAA